MTPAEALIELRKVLSDTVEPYGWDTHLLRSYIEEGEAQFCEDTGMFLDRRNYSVTTEAGVNVYLLPEEIININACDFDGMKLIRATPTSAQRSADAAPPIIYETEENSGMISFWPTPDAVYNIKLAVWRGARVKAFTADVFEVPAAFHRAMIEYAAYRAYLIHDQEYEDKKRSAQHYSQYFAYVARGKRWVDRAATAPPVVTNVPFYNV